MYERESVYERESLYERDSFMGVRVCMGRSVSELVGEYKNVHSLVRRVSMCVSASANYCMYISLLSAFMNVTVCIRH